MNSSFLNISHLKSLNCSQLPIGSYEIEAFATYDERQKNPTQKDIANFKITSWSSGFFKGSFLNLQNNISYDFNASCYPTSYQGIPELKLHFFANNLSGLNLCSGIYNFPDGIFGSAMYVGAPSLTTGDANYTACEGGCYGTLIP